MSRLLPVGDAGEVGVLSLDEHARMQQHLHEETCLPLGESERGHGVGALTVGVLNPPAARLLVRGS